MDPLASFFRRLLAWIIDYLLISFISSFILSFLLIFIFGFEGPETFVYDENFIRDMSDTLGPWQYLIFVIWWLYEAGFLAGNWQATPGKRLLGLYVTDKEGYPLSFSTATIRYLGKILGTLIFFIGYLLALFSRNRQALHDMIAGTLVLRLS
jgi:uncharacterized RDD family membrane protein YckC